MTLADNQSFLSALQTSPPLCQPGTGTRPPSPGDPLLFGDYSLQANWAELHLGKTLCRPQHKQKMSSMEPREVGGVMGEGVLQCFSPPAPSSGPQVTVMAPVFPAASPCKTSGGLGFLAPQQPAQGQSPPKRLGSLGLFYRKVIAPHPPCTRPPCPPHTLHPTHLVPRCSLSVLHHPS